MTHRERALLAIGYALADALRRLRENPSDKAARADYIAAKAALEKHAKGRLAPVSH